MKKLGMLTMRVAKNVTKLRAKSGLGSRELSLAAKLAYCYISHIETHRKQPSLDALEALAKVLKVDPVEMFKP